MLIPRLVGFKRQPNSNWRRSFRPKNRHDADYCTRLAVEVQRLADDRAVGMELFAPESFSQQASGRRANLVVRSQKVASQHGPHAVYLKIPFAREPSAQCFGLGFAEGLTVPGGTSGK